MTRVKTTTTTTTTTTTVAEWAGGCSSAEATAACGACVEDTMKHVQRCMGQQQVRHE
jgi:hypothetical protein